MTGTDPWNTTDTLDASTLDVMVTRLEARAQDAHFVRMLDAYLDAMKIDEAQHVLDLGCGTGVATRRICARKEFKGNCHGIDLSGYLIDAATRISDQENLSHRNQVRGRGHTLPGYCRLQLRCRRGAHFVQPCRQSAGCSCRGKSRCSTGRTDCRFLTATTLR